VFVHARAFRNRNRPPEVNQLVTFELSSDAQGRPCAEDVARVGEVLQQEPRRAGLRQHKPRRSRQRSVLGKAVSYLVALGILGGFVYPRIHEYLLRTNITTAPVLSPFQETPPTFRCDGRTFCSEMTSCEEATFFIRSCPGAKMDGDADGVPRESQ
jgi:Excalibur calcium-binding domain